MMLRTKIRPSYLWLTCLFTGLVSISCNNSSFQEKPAAAAVAVPRVVNLLNTDPVFNGGSLNVQSVDPISFNFQKNNFINIAGPSETVFQPLELVFAVDMSKSTENELIAIKNSAGDLVESLAGIGLDLSIGFVGFVDSINGDLFNLTRIKNTNPVIQQQNIDNFRNFINAKQNVSNSDFQEGGLLGIRTAVSMLSGSQNSSAAKVIIYITDEVGHNGGPEGSTPSQYTRNCSVNNTNPQDNIPNTTTTITNFKNTLTNPQNFKLYYSVPSVSEVTSTRNNSSTSYIPCEFQYPTQQMSALLSLTGNTGGELKNSFGQPAWPLNQSSTLVQTITSQLDRDNISNSARNQCALTNLRITDLSNNSQVLHNWEQDVNTAFTNYVESESLNLDNIIAGKTLSKGNHQLSIELSRCCADSDVSIGSTSVSCNAQSYNQTINYSLDVN